MFDINTQSEFHAAFWQGVPQGWSKYRNKQQNEWPTALRVEFMDFVDFLAKQGNISEDLAQRVTG
jgi:hypothetical protein